MILSAVMIMDYCMKTPLPFLKWPGGKRKLAKCIIPHFPMYIDRYWEPFVGGGGIFFALTDFIDQATLSDANAELVTTYNVVKKNVKDLIEALHEHAHEHAKDSGYYFQVRDSEPDGDMETAARLIYLNKTGFNGLYRMNSQGKYNVSKGSDDTAVTICDEERLLLASGALSRAEIVHGDFSGIEPGPGDCVYCDPPYDGGFVQYVADGFTSEQQREIRDCCVKWSDAGATVILSNADTPFIRELYDDRFHIEEINVQRTIGAKSETKIKAPEILAVRQPPL